MDVVVLVVICKSSSLEMLKNWAKYLCFARMKEDVTMAIGQIHNNLLNNQHKKHEHNFFSWVSDGIYDER